MDFFAKFATTTKKLKAYVFKTIADVNRSALFLFKRWSAGEGF